MSQGTTKRLLGTLRKTSNLGSGNEMILPNNSGDHRKSIKRDAPTKDQDLVNKEYVDGQDDSHLQDAKDYTDAEIVTHTADEDAHHDKLHAATHEVAGDDLVNHDDLTGFVANEHIDWTNATQDFLTTGDAEMMDLVVNGTSWNKYGASAIGTKEFQYLPSPAPSTQTALKIFNSMDAANSMGLGMFIQHKPTVQRDGIHAAIGGYNMVEGTNFNGSNTIAALNFGNFQYFSGLGCTSITSGSVLTDVLAVDVFGANAIDSVQFLAKDIYGVRAIPVINATCTDAYGYYYKASTGGTISGTEYGINLEEPTEGATYNRQAVLEGDGTGSGIWFDGKLGQRISSCNDRLCVKNVATDRPIDRTSDVAVATVTVANTTTETLLWTGAMAANSLLAGNLFKFHCDGIISNGDSAVATDQVTLRIKVGGSTVATLNPALKKIPVGSHWHIDANATQRTIGAAGPRAVHIDMDIAGATTTVVAIANINTTNNMDVTITAEWASAAAANTISLYQGFMEYKN